MNLTNSDYIKFLRFILTIFTAHRITVTPGLKLLLSMNPFHDRLLVPTGPSTQTFESFFRTFCANRFYFYFSLICLSRSCSARVRHIGIHGVSVRLSVTRW